MKTSCPCWNCGDREVGCHGGCEKYRKYRAAVLRGKKAAMKMVEVNDYEARNSFFRQEGARKR